MSQTPEIMIDGEVIVFEYYNIHAESETGFMGSLEINAIFENDVELNWKEHQDFMKKYGEDKIKNMILKVSTVYE